jgi:hypothetical protein
VLMPRAQVVGSTVPGMVLALPGIDLGSTPPAAGEAL